MAEFKKYLPSIYLLGTALASLPAAAQSVELYGLLDLGIGSQQLAGESKRTVLQNGALTTSFIGFRGSEDLGGGTSAIFVLESFLRADTGEIGRANNDVFFQRQSWVGLSNRTYGALRLGRQSTPNWLTTIGFSPFGSSSSYGPLVQHVYLPSAIQPMITGVGVSDSAWANGIGYTSPIWGGFSLMALYAPSEGTVSGNRRSGRLLYEAGPWSVVGSYEKITGMNLQQGAPAPALITAARPSFIANETSNAQFATAYDFSAFKLYGQYNVAKLNNNASEIELSTGQVSAGIPLGLSTIMLAVAKTQKQQTAQADISRRSYSAVYKYNFSKRTEGYAGFQNDRVTNLNNGNSVTLGIRHIF